MTRSFHPPVRVPSGPGPSDVNPRILEALTMPVSAPGSAGMDCCFVNLVSPGDTVIVAQNGVFGGRMKENVERCGASAVMVQDDWGSAVDPQKVEDAIRAHPEAKVLAFVHAEMPVTFSPRALEIIQKRQHKVQSWFLDMGLVMAYWGGNAQRAYHHTALAAGFAALGMEFVVDVKHRLPQLNCVRIPAGADDAKVRQHLLDEYNLEIGAGLGPLAGKVWRIGLMGHAANQTNVLFCLGALEAVLKRSGAVAAARDFYATTR